MWSNRTVASSDPDEFVTLIRPAGCKILVTERGQFDAGSTLIDIGPLYAQRRWERLARIAHVETVRPGILFLTAPGPSMFWNGGEIRQEHVLLFRSDAVLVSRSSGPFAWGAMTLADDDMEALCTSYPGCSSMLMSSSVLITPPAGALARLRLLHAAAGNVADICRGSANPAAFARWLEQALMTAMAEIVGAADVPSDTMARQHHQMIIRRFLEILEAHPVEPFPMQTISDAIGVSSRTLRMACQTQLGVSPTQFLLLRRMRQARRALQQADPDVTRVTDVATELGFWELGRFAVKYRQIFGETPSATLRAVGSNERLRSHYALA